MKLPKNIKNLGFTLVELMVVISIIAVLSTVGAAMYSNVNLNNRDAARQRDLNSIKQGLEFYFQIHNNYPQAGAKYIYTSLETVPWIPGLTPTYFDILPTDPFNASPYFYTYQPSTAEFSVAPSCIASTSYQFYILYANLEGSGNGTSGASITGCDGTTPTAINMTSHTYFLLSQ